MKSLIFILINLFITLHCSARIGLTKTQCDKAYGKPIKQAFNRCYVYKKAGRIEMWIEFNTKGKCIKIDYYPTSKLSLAKIKSICQLNGLSSNKVFQKPNGEIYTTSTKYKIDYDPFDYGLVIVFGE